eukprot:TRINITY_DN20871_c0_g2_i1.p1 TRINITY_DN20871_c0_g2~~TRINITY_DN20871_c0_g2_i1.p1  ORF type:complete len:178 (+),score=40.68 TRINITY_DN20871_c0_g2_i1:173-706(+)
MCIRDRYYIEPLITEPLNQNQGYIYDIIQKETNNICKNQKLSKQQFLLCYYATETLNSLCTSMIDMTNIQPYKNTSDDLDKVNQSMSEKYSSIFLQQDNRFSVDEINFQELSEKKEFYGIMNFLKNKSKQQMNFHKVNMKVIQIEASPYTCLLYTSDAADDMQCVDLGGRRIIKKKK